VLKLSRFLLGLAVAGCLAVACDLNPQPPIPASGVNSGNTAGTPTTGAGGSINLDNGGSSGTSPVVSGGSGGAMAPSGAGGDAAMDAGGEGQGGEPAGGANDGGAGGDNGFGGRP
jgi:hypothetical protein